MKNHIKLIAAFTTIGCIFHFKATAQQANSAGEVHGNFQVDVQYYNEDTAIGAPPVPEKVLMNGFGNVIFTKGNFSAGARYESYLNPMQGFDRRYKGAGIPFRYASYMTEGMEVTLGSFYEQFGNGLIFRSYEERSLGYDNAMDGIRLKYLPKPGVILKGFIARQRVFFDYGPGIVRGFDGELMLNELIPKFSTLKTQVTIGGSFVSKFQEDLNPVYKLPENVGASAGRINISHGKININAEYAYKINDPSSANKMIYKPGEAALLLVSYSQKGLGISFGAKRIDNMSFRSDRAAQGNNLLLNYLPALTKQHAYNLVAFYPYATQPNGEIGFQGEVVYTLKKGTPMGGEYGTTFLINYSTANGLDTTNLNNDYGYSSDYGKIGEEVYYKDFNIEVSRRVNKDLKVTLLYANQVYNKAVIQGLGGYPTIYANIGVVDLTYKLNAKHAIRTELQNLSTDQDMGDWASALIEYTISPHWFFSFIDQYNYGNKEDDKKIHYFTGSVAYIKQALRISLGYGRQRAGIFCVGGICRMVPASNGLMLTVSSSF